MKDIRMESRNYRPPARETSGVLEKDICTLIALNTKSYNSVFHLSEFLAQEMIK